MKEGWKKEEEKESLFMGVSQKKFFLSLPIPCGRKHDKFNAIDLNVTKHQKMQETNTNNTGEFSAAKLSKIVGKSK